MPVWPLNNVPTQDAYSDALTAQFPQVGRSSFSVQVYTAGVYYKLIRYVASPGYYYVDETEHFLAPVLANFSDPINEGLKPGELFGGIMFRSALAGTPATVTVI